MIGSTAAPVFIIWQVKPHLKRAHLYIKVIGFIGWRVKQASWDVSWWMRLSIKTPPMVLTNLASIQYAHQPLDLLVEDAGDASCSL